jgi:hypothetical protein
MTTDDGIIHIDPPSGWRFGFPKPAPDNLREMTDDDLNRWLISQGYPQSEIEPWISRNYKTPPCRFFIAR